MQSSVLTHPDARRVLDPTARHVPHISERIPTSILVNLVFDYVDRPIGERLAVDGGCETIDHVHSSYESRSSASVQDFIHFMAQSSYM